MSHISRFVLPALLASIIIPAAAQTSGPVRIAPTASTRTGIGRTTAPIAPTLRPDFGSMTPEQRAAYEKRLSDHRKRVEHLLRQRDIRIKSTTGTATTTTTAPSVPIQEP